MRREADSGILSHRWKVKLDNTKLLRNGLNNLHEADGGLYYSEREMR
jgi:hypothetical protein